MTRCPWREQRTAGGKSCSTRFFAAEPQRPGSLRLPSRVQLLLACVAQALLCFLTRLQFAQERIQQNRTWKGTSVAMVTLDRLRGIGLAAGDVTTCSCWTTRIKGVPVCISLSPQMSGWSIRLAVMLLRRCFPIQRLCFVANSTWAERFPTEAR